ncbi:MAG TPA: ABC transporter permease [Acidimicrobiia bacterium]|nr:ABC transporter permease [Acidimicrobiia bacterium]
MKTVREPSEARVISARLTIREQLSQIWVYRSLLVRMVRKELKVKYKSSVLGFMWSMLNPALYLVVFWLVFQVILQAGIPDFAIYLLSGLLVWNLFSTALASATVSITGNGSLVGKVSFPREVLPLASVGASLVHFFLQTIVLLGALVLFRYEVAWAHLPAVPVALVVLVLLTAALSIFLAAANVYLRDTQHLVELSLLAWFWITPIVYEQQRIASRLAEKSWGWVHWLNPISSIVLTFQRAIYNVTTAPAPANPGPRGLGGGSEGVLRILPTNMDAGWYFAHLGGVAVASVVCLVGALWFFGRVSANFAEEL